MSFRPATLGDEKLFYALRLLDEAAGDQAGWRKGDMTTPDTHHKWFTARLVSCSVRMLVWNDGKTDAGTVRIETNGEVTFQAAHAKQTLLLNELRTYTGRSKMKFTVDKGDPKAESLERAGFVESPVRFFTHQP